jgi:hypothetical protein
VKDATYNLNGAFKPTMKRFADLDGPDFFPTPPWATHALIENEKFDGEIWECACGDGTMSRVLEKTGQPVRSSDLYDRGFGDVGVDFQNATSAADNIVTNPSYNCAESFVASGLKLARRKLALLLRLAFLEGPIAPRPSSALRRLRAFGSLASGLLFIRPVPSGKVVVLPRMLGTTGTRTRLVQPS